MREAHGLEKIWQDNPGRIMIPLGAAACLLPSVTAAAALATGVMLALVFSNPYRDDVRKLTPLMLGLSITCLGAGMDLRVIGRVGAHGFLYTMTGITVTLLLGRLLGRFFGTERDTSLLVTVGTAICGGSAIAAVAPVIRAKAEEVSVALGIVFILNAVGLCIFPWIGHLFHLSETQFGLWAALAIHDTSSVVGATLQYGTEALRVGTTVKLARALWIIPLVAGISFLRARESGGETREPGKKPWFILGFVIAAALATWVPFLQPLWGFAAWLGARGIVVTLFLIGTGMTRESLKAVGATPFLQGAALWVVVAAGTLIAVCAGWL